MNRKPKIDDYVFANTGDYYIDSAAELESWQKKQIVLKENYNRALIDYKERRNYVWQRIIIWFAVIAAILVGGFFGVRGIVIANANAQHQYYVEYVQWVDGCRANGGVPSGPYNVKSQHSCVFPDGYTVYRNVVS